MSDREKSAGFVLPRALHDHIARVGKRDYPEETCGLIFGAGGDLEIVEMENVQNRVHAENPKQHDRDATEAYYFDPPAMKRALEEHERAGRPLAAIYHSHPDVGAYFSDMDSEAAAPLGSPSFPGIVYLVASIRGGAMDDLKAFDWSEAEGRYVEVELRVEG